MQIQLFFTQFNTPEPRRFLGLITCYLLLPILNTACVSKPEVSVLPEPTMVAIEPKPLVFSDQTLRSSNIDPEMRNAQCNLYDAQVFRAEVLKHVNQLRAQEQMCGGTKMTASEPLMWGENLQSSAYEHAAQMAVRNLFSHTSLDGRELRDRALAAGYDYALLGENITAGQTDVRAVIQAWLTSPSHCKQMLHTAFTEVAVACVAKPNSFYGRYWVMNLGHQRIVK